MKKKIHPEYFEKAKVFCACGATFEVGSTKPEMRVEVCSKCHPAWVGGEKIIDKRGQVEKFLKKYGRKSDS